MAESRKIRRTFLSVQHKKAISEELNKGMSVKYLARQYGVSRDIIHNIRHENERSTGFGKRGGHPSKHKNRRRCSNEETEDRLYTWIQDQYAMGNQLTDPLIQEKAVELFGEQEGTSFVESKEWLADFKSRYKIDVVRIHRAESSIAEEPEEEITDVSNEYDDEEDVDVYGVYDEDPVRMVNEDENITDDEQEDEIDEEEREAEEDEDEATEADKSQLSMIAKKKSDLNILREIIKTYAYNNQAVLIMGEAIINILRSSML